MLKGFRDFILRGNVVDLAVAVLIGAAFGQITSSLTSNIITPFISALIGAPDFSALVFHMHAFIYGAIRQCDLVQGAVSKSPRRTRPAHPAPGDIHLRHFLPTLRLTSLLAALAVYFYRAPPLHKLPERMNGLKPNPEAVTHQTLARNALGCTPATATRCKFCTQPIS